MSNPVKTSNDISRLTPTPNENFNIRQHYRAQNNRPKPQHNKPTNKPQPPTKTQQHNQNQQQKTKQKNPKPKHTIQKKTPKQNKPTKTIKILQQHHDLTPPPSDNLKFRQHSRAENNPVNDINLSTEQNNQREIRQSRNAHADIKRHPAPNPTTDTSISLNDEQMKDISFIIASGFLTDTELLSHLIEYTKKNDNKAFKKIKEYIESKYYATIRNAKEVHRFVYTKATDQATHNQIFLLGQRLKRSFWPVGI